MKGSLRQRGKDSFQLRYYVGINPKTGKDVYKATTFRGSKREAQTALAKLIAGAADAPAAAPIKAPKALDPYLDEWLAWLKGQGATTKTLRSYAQKLAPARKVFGRRLLADLEGARKEFDLFFAALATEPGEFRHHRGQIVKRRKPLAPRTVNHVYSVLHNAFQCALAWEDMRRNPLARLAGRRSRPKVPKKPPTIWNSEQIGPALALLASDAFYPLVLVALSGGLRLGEALALQWGDCHLDGANPRLEIVRSLADRDDDDDTKEPKTASGRRTVDIDPDTVAALRAHRRTQAAHYLAAGLGRIEPTTPVFPDAFGQVQKLDAVSRQWGVLRDRLSLPPCTYHGLRHTHASICIAEGMDVVSLADRLGHSSPNVTLGVYAHLFKVNHRIGAAIMGKLFDRIALASRTA